MKEVKGKFITLIVMVLSADEKIVQKADEYLENEIGINT